MAVVCLKLYSDSWVEGLDAEKKMKLIDKLKDDEPYVRQFGERLAPIENEPPVTIAPPDSGPCRPIAMPLPEQPAEPPPAIETPTYTVQGGDTLGAIAKKFNVTVAALVAENNLENPNLIRPGQMLKIPQA